MVMVKRCPHAEAAAPTGFAVVTMEINREEPPNGASNRNRMVRSHVRSVDAVPR
jgi:hypothetical protein